MTDICCPLKTCAAKNDPDAKKCWNCGGDIQAWRHYKVLDVIGTALGPPDENGHVQIWINAVQAYHDDMAARVEKLTNTPLRPGSTLDAWIWELAQRAYQHHYVLTLPGFVQTTTVTASFSAEKLDVRED